MCGPGIDGLRKRFKECACSDAWLGFPECSATVAERPLDTKNTYNTNIRVEHGRGSSTGQEPGDIMMSVNYEFTLVTALEETPDTHTESRRCA